MDNSTPERSRSQPIESLLAPVESFHDEMDEDDLMARYSNRTRPQRPSRGNKQKRRQSSSSTIVMPNRQASLSKEKGLYVHTRKKYAVIAAVVGACIVAASVAGVLISSSSDNKKEKEEDLHTTRTSIFSPDSDPNTDEFWGDAKGARMIVKYDTDAALQLAKHCAHKIVKQDHNGEEGKFMAFYGDASCKAKLEEAQESKDIEVIYDYPIEAFRLNEPRTTIISQERLLSDEITPWGMRQIGLEGVTYGNATEVTVCVVDSGINIDHPEFTDSVSSINGVDVQRFWGEPWKWNEDHDGHGTFVAGILATDGTTSMATYDNSKGFKLFVTRSLGDDGRGYESDAINAMKKCVEHGADIINLSFGSPYKSTFLDDYMTRLKQSHPNLMIVAAAGNTGNSVLNYPAAYPHVISVAASNIDNNRFWLSTANHQVEFAGPGHQILTTTTAEAMVMLEGDPTTDADDGFRFPGRFVAQPDENVGSVTGEVMDCGNGSLACGRAASGKICLIEQTSESPSIPQMIKNCQQAGGIGAIMFSSRGGNYKNWNPDEQQHNLQIIAVGVDDTVGLELKYGSNHDLYINKLAGKGVTGRAKVGDDKDLASFIGQTVTIGSENEEQEYVYEAASGTSLAAPHVSAVAAYLLSHKGDICDLNQIRYAMAATAYNPNGVCDSQLGHGIVHAGKALEFLEYKFDCTTTPIPHSLVQGGCSLVGATPLY